MDLPELWPGADVRWVGPPRERGGVRLRPGERAVVVDPGRHGMTSFSALYHARGARPRRPRRGVTVRLAGGEAVRVPRRHLELVAPEHPLRPEPDASLADWLLQRLEPWGRAAPVPVAPVPVASFVPRDFPAVACLRHRGGHPGELDPATARALVEVLRAHTSSHGDVCFAVWTGWGDVPPQRFPGAAVVPTEGRGHFLLRGPLEGALEPVGVATADRPVSGIWWPADRAWLVATEIDFAWTFVGGSERLVEQLLRDPALDATAADPDSPAIRPDEQPPPAR